MPPSATAAATLAIAILSLALSALQVSMGVRVGTDHPGHAFLIRGLRANGYRLFVRIPRLLNDAVVAALPLYLHWIFAHFHERAMFWAERLLNPMMNGAHVLLFAAVAATAASEGAISSANALLATGCFAFTPQFFHALSARNFGLSSRSIGLFLLTLFLLAAYRAEVAPDTVLPWVALAFTAYLIFAFNTFGAQAMVLIGVIVALLGGRWHPVAGVGLGLILFLAVHPRYSIGYLRHTMRFIYSYATELAPVYVLSRRHSIWRDLVWDIWIRFRANPAKGFRYAYENSVLIALLLNPLSLFAAAGVFGLLPKTGLIAFAGDLALAGCAAAFLTSFRATRFLGEPERYIEAITPWGTLVGAALLVGIGPTALAGVLAIFLVLALVQLSASRILLRHISGKPIDLTAAEIAIRKEHGEAVRLASNNELLTKRFMLNDWDFSYCIAVGRGYCGMTITQAFSTFPFLRREACEQVVRSCRINTCVLDRTLYDTIFDEMPEDLVVMRILHETEGLRVLSLDWRAEIPGEHTV